MKNNTMNTIITGARRFLVFVLLVASSSCAQDRQTGKDTMTKDKNMTRKEMKSLSTATFGGGCFWCVEAVFQQLEGVERVVSGYEGGHVDQPRYKDVCTGTTGHAEVCQIAFDPQRISYIDLLEAFFSTHDPTTLNRQGNDTGTQYRSVIFYHSSEQKYLAERYKKQLDESRTFRNPIVTEISQAAKFFEAEEYHQNYYFENGQQPYCQFVIRPKLDKLTKQFKAKLKTGIILK